jgi:hypothetical protein
VKKIEYLFEKMNPILFSSKIRDLTDAKCDLIVELCTQPGVRMYAVFGGHYSPYCQYILHLFRVAPNLQDVTLVVR